MVEQYPAVAVLGALFYIEHERGVRSRALDRCRGAPVARASFRMGAPARVAHRQSGSCPDGSTLASWRALLRSQQCRYGLDAMRRDAELALDGLSAASGLRASALLGPGACLPSWRGDGARRLDLRPSCRRGHGRGRRAKRGGCACRARLLCDRPRRLASGPELRRGGELGRAGVRPRRVHRERAQLRLVGRAGTPPRRCRTGTRGRHSGRAASAASRLLASYLLGANPARARPRYVVARRHRRRTGSPTTGARTSCRSDPISACSPRRSRSSSRRLDAMRTGDVGPSSLTAAELRLVPVPAHAPHVPADRRAALPLPQHREVPGDLHLSEARCLVARRGNRAVARVGLLET